MLNQVVSDQLHKGILHITSKDIVYSFPFFIRGKQLKIYVL